MTKNISLSDDAYNALAALKEKDKSFSDIILEITKKYGKKNLTSFAGKWHGSKEEAKKIFEEIMQERRKTRARDFPIE